MVCAASFHEGNCWVPAVHQPTGPTVLAVVIPPVLQVKPVSTPLVAAAWKRALANYPSREFAEMITNRIEQGFRIGLRGTPPPKAQAQEFTVSPG